MEAIKQEIISCIYENGENLITGPVLQEVLLDMVDDTNAKIASGSVPGDIVDKTGSWDDAADWVEENSSSLVHGNDLDGYATEQWVEDQGYLKEHQDLGGYATTESLNDLSESVANDLANLPEPDLSDYATKEYVEATSASVKEWVENKHYLTTASLSGSVTEESVQFMINDATSSVKTWVGDQNYATETFVSQAIAEIPGTDLTGYATEAWVEEQGYLKEHQDISGLATTESVTSLSESVAQDFANLNIPDVSGLATTSSVNALSESVVAFSESVEGYGISNLWNAVNALEDVEILTWDDESGEYTAVDVATSESLSAVSESVADDFGNLSNSNAANNPIADFLENAGLAIRAQDPELGGYEYTLTPVVSLSKSVASDIASLSESIAAISGSDLSGYATTSSVNALSESVAEVAEGLSSKVGEEDVYNILASTGLAEPEYGEWTVYEAAKKDELLETSSSLSASIAAISASGGVDLSGYVTTSSFENLEGRVDTLEEDVANLANARDALEGAEIITWDDESEEWTAVPLATSESVGLLSQSISQSIVDSVDLVTNKAAASITSLSESVATDIQNARTEAAAGFDSVNQGVVALSASFDQRINDLPGGEEIWVRGEGSNSAVLSGSGCTAPGQYAVAEGLAVTASGLGSHAEGFLTIASGLHSHAEGYYTVASGQGSHAEGTVTTASGQGSHAEGNHTAASKDYSHAEGSGTIASGSYSHAEGEGTIASNTYEHAQGKLNATASRQIFSVGAGDAVTRRKNAISIITGSNPSASIYIYGVGSYNGTNPEPGVNDIATVINSLTGSSADLSGYATTASLNSVSQSLSASIAAGGVTLEQLQDLGLVYNNDGYWVAADDQEHGGLPIDGEGSFWTSAPAIWRNLVNQNLIGYFEDYDRETDTTYWSIQDTIGTAEWSENPVGALLRYISNGKLVAWGSEEDRWVSPIVGEVDGKLNTSSFNTVSASFDQRINNIITGSGVDLSGYATTASVNQISYSVDYRLDQLEQEKEIPFWSSGSGEYSVVRKNGSFAEAIGEGSIFLGYGGGRIINANYYRCEYGTWAPQPSDSNPKYYLSHEVNSSQWSRVEVGQNLVSGNDHLGKRVAQVVSKGQDTSGETAGMYWITLSTYVGTPVWLMLVEVGSRIAGKGAIGGGCGTDTSNDYETGLGKYSRSGSGQIFSVGVGSSKTDRRNAISIVTGSNPSASVYIYGVGSYDGTNPQPGTNDLASVIASGGTSYNVETWTFILEDSSSVTKNVVVA